MYISDQLVKLIERSADDLSKRWVEDVQSRPELNTYHGFDSAELYRRAHNVYSQLGKWISRETSKADVERYYKAMGARRKREGFEISEVIQALIITRRLIWLKVLAEGVLDTALDLHKAVELNNRAVLFFDRAIYVMAKGYEDEVL